MFTMICKFFLLMLCTFSPALGKSSHRVVGSVNHEAISHEDVLNRMRLLMLSSGQELTPDIVKRLYPQVLQTLMDEALQRQIAKKFAAKVPGLEVTPAEIKERLALMEERNGMPKGGLIQLFKERGLSLRSFERQIEASLYWTKYIEAKYGALVSVSPAEVKRYLERWVEDHKGVQYQLGEIVLYVPFKSQFNRVMAHAQQLLSFLYQGTPFIRVAQQFSEAKSHEHGGMLGWRSLNRLEPELRSFLQKAAIGDFIGPLALPSANQPAKIVILAVLDRKHPQELHLQPPTEDEVIALLRGEALERWSRKEMTQLRQTIHYEVGKAWDKDLEHMDPEIPQEAP